MPRKPFPHCKAEGCTAPRYVWPNGARAVYCADHLHLRNTKQRDGLPPMSGDMRRTLLHLRECKAQGWPFVQLNPTYFNGRTIRSLVERDWAFVSPGIDGDRVAITGRGLDALEVYLPARNRHDGICPSCEENPRHIRNGTMIAYCIDCDRAITRKKQARLRRRPEYTDRPCSKCKQNPRMRHSNGLGCSYCADCEAERTRKRTARRRDRELELVRAGGILLCARCHAQPRKVFENSIARYCEECLPAMHRRWKLNQAFKHVRRLHK